MHIRITSYNVCYTKLLRKIARGLLEQKLAACVNILDNVESMYWWDDKIEESSEVVLIIKCLMRKVHTVIPAIRELHPYEVPCISAWPVLKANVDFIKWVEKITDPQEEA